MLRQTTTFLFSDFENKIYQKTKEIINPYIIPDLQNTVMEYVKGDLPMPQKNFVDALKTCDQNSIQIWQDLGALMIGIDSSLPYGGPLPEALWHGDYTAVKEWRAQGANFIGIDVMSCRDGRWPVPYEAIMVEDFQLFHSLLYGMGRWDTPQKTRGKKKNQLGAECSILQCFLLTFKDYLRRFEDNKKLIDEIFCLLIKKPNALQIPQKSNPKTGPLALTAQHFDYLKLLLENTDIETFSKIDMANALKKSIFSDNNNILTLLLENKIFTKSFRLLHRLFFKLPKCNEKMRKRIMSLFLENGFDIIEHPTIIQEAIDRRQPDNVIQILFLACQKNNMDLLSKENNFHQSVVDFAKFKGRAPLAEWMEEQLQLPSVSKKMCLG